MRILMLKAYYYPEIAASSYLSDNVIEAITDNGDEIVLYSPTPTRGVTKEVRECYKKKKYEEKYGGLLKIHRFSMYQEGRNPLLRAVRYFCCCLAQLYKGISTPKVDLISIGSTPPIQGALAGIIKKIKKVPVVYSLQDIFPDSLVSTGLAREDSLFYKFGSMVEKFTYKNMDKIIVISEDFKRNIMTKGVPENKIEVIYNWVDENAVIPIDKEKNTLFEEMNLERNSFHIVYAGNLGHAQNIEIILQAAGMILNYKDIKFVIFGGGAQEDYYKQMSENMGLSNVMFFPLQPYEKVSQVYSLGDASIVSCKKGLGRSAMPSKTWSIMSAGTAVLANFDDGTDMQRIIENNKLGLFTKSGDAEGLKEAVLKLHEDKELCKKMGCNGRQFVLDNLTRSIGTKKYIDVYKSLKRSIR
jgi:glycosyltransferase involved in cell wall biosynthesis